MTLDNYRLFIDFVLLKIQTDSAGGFALFRYTTNSLDQLIEKCHNLYSVM